MNEELTTTAYHLPLQAYIECSPYNEQTSTEKDLAKDSQTQEIAIYEQIFHASNEMNRLLYQIKNTHDALANCFQLLDKKLNLILQLVNKPKNLKNSQLIIISITSITFYSKAPLAAGDSVQLKITFVDSFTAFFAQASIEQCQASNESDLPYQINATFENLPQETEDIIMQHLFAQEKKLLKIRKAQQKSIRNDHG